MAKKYKKYRCGWKQDHSGYTLEEATVLKSKIDLQNINDPRRLEFKKSEIVPDPRGGYMIRCELIST
ncbi:MAG: hypothetical protein IKG14_05310 [Clostridia bacterium]|nr:hypothetical protein [Clostridia bacterium]